MKSVFSSQHLVQFYETDLMGIVHHSNYLRFMEEARVAWAHSRGLLEYQKPQMASHFAVLETSVKHVKPAFFGDQLSIYVQARLLGKARIEFQYQIKKQNDELLAMGTSVHVALDSNLQPMRLPQAMKNILEKETWIET